MTIERTGKLRVAVLMGGQSSEHDVSIASGLKVLAALDREKYDVVPVTIARDGAWLVDHLPEKKSLTRSREAAALSDSSHVGAGTALPAIQQSADLDPLRATRIDVAFLALHGPYGEDGTVQGLLTLLGLPYTGSGILASALAMDKVKAKELYALHGLPVARQAVVLRAQFAAAGERGRESLAEAALTHAGLPCVVKPVAGGSSVATSIVRSAGELVPALARALEADHRALVEELIEGVEVTCGVLGGGAHEPAQALPVTEIVPVDGAFFDFRAKYTAEACREITPARIPEDVARRVQEHAVRAHEALGCEGMSRSDFIIRGDTPYILETNTIPGMTETSLLPQAAAHAGIPFGKLLDRLIESALRRAEGQGGA